VEGARRHQRTGAAADHVRGANARLILRITPDPRAHIEQAIDDLAVQVRETVEAVPGRVGSTIRDAAYVALGAVDLGGERARSAVASLLAMPRHLRSQVQRAPADLRRTLEELRERGEVLTRRLGRHESVREAERRFGQVVRGTKAAATSTRTAVRSSAEAAREVAGTVGSPGTPYEHRTYTELYELAAGREIEGRSSMTKDELIQALRR
jgi:hypothetical protein